MPSGDPPHRRLAVSVTDVRGRSIDTGLARWLARVAPASARGSVVVALLSDARVRELNRQFRGRDSVTDVLSFPNGPSEVEVERSSRAMSRHLGDIVIATGAAGRQARAAGHDQRRELEVLALHGLLHLLGYDHHEDNGRMARLERRLTRKGGLTQGLIERNAPSRATFTPALRRDQR